MPTCQQLQIDMEIATDDYDHYTGEEIRLDAEIAGIDADIEQATTDSDTLDQQIEAIDGEIAEIREPARARELTEIDDDLQAVEARKVEILRELFGSADTPPPSDADQPRLVDELNELAAVVEALEIRRALLADGSLEPTLNEDEQAAVDAKTTERGVAQALRDDVIRFRDQELVPLRIATDQDRAAAETGVTEAGALIFALQLEFSDQGCVLSDEPEDVDQPEVPGEDEESEPDDEFEDDEQSDEGDEDDEFEDDEGEEGEESDHGEETDEESDDDPGPDQDEQSAPEPDQQRVGAATGVGRSTPTVGRLPNDIR